MDKCGIEFSTKELRTVQTENWGYGPNDLLEDISSWENNEFVHVNDIGNSIMDNKIWLLSVTNDRVPENKKYAVSIHARTHPVEVQSSYVVNAIIDLLLSRSTLSKLLLDSCHFYIIPMINPDGVELGFPRENANEVDLETDWNKSEPQKEVKALRDFFMDKMNSGSPIVLALNMHSSYLCKRYFVYHHENGTSETFTGIQKRFIRSVKSYYNEGIENWDFFISWTDGTPQYYPESWFWNNYRENVLALTYEDMNCATAGNYHTTAKAFLNGIADFLRIREINHMKNSFSHNEDIKLFPNPVSAGTTAKLKLNTTKTPDVRISVFNATGKTVLIKSLNNPGNIFELNTKNLNSGLYFISVSSEKFNYSTKLIIQ